MLFSFTICMLAPAVRFTTRLSPPRLVEPTAVHAGCQVTYREWLLIVHGYEG